MCSGSWFKTSKVLVPVWNQLSWPAASCSDVETQRNGSRLGTKIRHRLWTGLQTGGKGVCGKVNIKGKWNKFSNLSTDLHQSKQTVGLKLPEIGQKLMREKQKFEIKGLANNFCNWGITTLISVVSTSCITGAFKLYQLNSINWTGSMQKLEVKLEKTVAKELKKCGFFFSHFLLLHKHNYVRCSRHTCWCDLSPSLLAWTGCTNGQTLYVC